MKELAKTTFVVSFLTYLLFGVAEYLRPGFVSHVFSLHVFLPLIFGSGILWGAYLPEKRRSLTGIVLIGVISCIFALIVWREGEIFGDLRLLLSLATLFLPILSWLAVSKQN